MGTHWGTHQIVSLQAMSHPLHGNILQNDIHGILVLLVPLVDNYNGSITRFLESIIYLHLVEQ